MLDKKRTEACPEGVEEGTKANPSGSAAFGVGATDHQRGQRIMSLVSLCHGYNVSERDLIDHTRVKAAGYTTLNQLLSLDEIWLHPAAVLRWTQAPKLDTQPARQ